MAAYSPGVVAEGRLLVVSGQGPFVDGAEANIVRCGVFLNDIGDFDGMNTAYRAVFSDPLPARTTVGCTLSGMRVEIDCIAVL